MKLVEILAKKLDVWPTGAAIAVQDGDERKTVKFGSKHANPSIALMGLKDVWQARDWKYTHQSDFDHSVLASDWKTAIVTHDQWKAERDRQNGGEWKRHRGGKQPVADGVLVEVKLRDGDIQQHYAECFAWPFTDCDAYANIMNYRVISQPKAEEVGVHKLIQDIGMYSHQDEIIHGPISMGDEVIAPAHQKWGEIDGPILWRDTVNELDAYIEEFTRERESLINRLAYEGFALLPATHPVMGVADIGLPIEEWQIGDIVEVISVSDQSSAPLGVFKITDIDASEPKYELDDQYFPNHNQMKFIRRP